MNDQGFVTTTSTGDGAALLIIFAIVGIGLLFALVFYILAAIGLKGIAETEGHGDKSWWAFIPILNYFLLTKLVEDDTESLFNGKFTLIFGISLVASFVIGGFFPFITIVPSILLLVAMYHITMKYSNNVVINMVLLVLSGGLWASIQLFRYRNRESLYE